MRGKAVRALAAIRRDRITPAHAGKSERRDLELLSRGDHPRPCGEKALLKLQSCTVTGSPPPMRGKVARVSCQGSRRRITPAHAGKRYKMELNDTFDEDHPRPCGEKRPYVTHWHYLAGSPPPMRGKVITCRNMMISVRITPAHAGKSLPIRCDAIIS